MDKRIEELVDYTKATFGLDDYNLLTHQLRRSVNIFNETEYILGMEWLPPHAQEREEDGSNPEGTASIDIDIHTRQFKSVIFVGGKSYANGVQLQQHVSKHDIIKGLERRTGLTYGEQFQLVKEEKGEYRFQECIDGVKVSPSGFLEIKFDKDGNLTLFSIDGHFPPQDKVKKESFSLTQEEVEPLAKQQLKLIEFPSHEQERLIPVYGMEEIFVTNDAQSTIPFEFIAERRSYLQIDKTLEWQTPIDQPFESTNIDLQEKVDVEQVFQREPHPDTFPITKTEQEQCITAVENFLRQELPNDTGKWVLKTLHRNQGYILATIKHTKPDNRVFQRKLQVFLDAESLHVLNYMDNKFLLDMYQGFKEPEKITLSKEGAYDKIKSYLEITPVYVYDFERHQYLLCGKLDCPYGVHAVSGEVVLLDEL
ncbi:hypothetical protein [Bacillus piscicola]|uniref:hypothetical protein n=1 Tax=Bacillus piscicola TaxID=1632684 RepID=UPI001F088DF2|nr:hypothetical protein [Bacillus piscicola]